EYRLEDSTCLSAINLTIIDSLVPIFTNFSSILSDFIENKNFGQLFYLARTSSRTFYDTHFVDIIDLAQNLETLSNIELIDQICLSLIDAMDEIIIFNWQHPSFSGTIGNIQVFPELLMECQFSYQPLITIFQQVECMIMQIELVLLVEWIGNPIPIGASS
ncbi:MAG: hypothetical protein ACTSSK_06500, partial [Candidatus Heimdallarchaeota archaeon]